jgi:hypothetical protein
MGRNGNKFYRGRGGGQRGRGGRYGGRYNNDRNNQNFNKYMGNSKYLEGGRDYQISSQKKVNNNSSDDKSSKIATASYEKNNNKIFKTKTYNQKSVETNVSQYITSSDAFKHQALITVPNLQEIKKNPKLISRLIDSTSKWETSLVNACGTANVDNQFITAALHRSEVCVAVNGEQVTVMEYQMKPYKTKVPDENKVFTIDMPAVPLSAEALQRQNDELHLKFLEEEAARFFEHEEARELAYQSWSSSVFLATRAWPDGEEGFEYEEFQNGEPVVLTNAPATIDEVVIGENNQVSIISKPNLVTASIKLKYMTEAQKEQTEVKDYLLAIYEHNKLVRKCQAKHESDVVKVISIIKSSLPQDVQEALENHLKVKYDKTIDQVIAMGDPATLMKHVAAVSDILYLESTSEEQTKELLGTIINYYRSIDKLKRNKWETYSTFFARYSSCLRIIKQCALLLNDSTHIMSEEHAVKTLIECTDVDPNHLDMHSYIQSLKTKSNQKKATVVEQIIEMKRYIGEADAMILDKHRQHKDHEKKMRDKDHVREQKRKHERKRERDSAEVSHIETDNPSAYFSVQDLLNVDIDPATIEKLTKVNKTSASSKPGQPAPSKSSTSSAPASATSTAPTTSRVYAPKGNKSAGRGGMSYNPSSRVVTASGTTGRFINADSHFNSNEDFEDLNCGIFADDDEVFCTCIDTCFHQSYRKRPITDERDGLVITKLHHDDGNSSYHCVNSRKNLREIRKPDDSFISNMSGISPGWTTTHELVGIHPLLGLVAYNPSYRVSLINPNILINDGWQLSTFSGVHGDIVKVYHKMFEDTVHTLEFIMNRHGQLIANDPADDPNFKLPSHDFSKTLGSMPRLREYLYNNYSEMINEYKNSRDDFFQLTIQQYIDSQSLAQANFEGVSDENDDDDSRRDECDNTKAEAQVHATEGRHPYYE